MAGMSSDQTDAAIITPAANPKKIRWARALVRPRNKNTRLDPRLVIKKVKPVPTAAQISASCMELTPVRIS